MYDAKSPGAVEMRRSPALALLLMVAFGAGAGAGPGSALAAPVVNEVTRRQALEHYRVGQELMYAEAWERAEAEFKSAIGLDPLMVVAHYGLGQTYMAMKRYPEAIRAFSSTIAAHKEVDALRMVDQAQADQRVEDQILQLREGLRAIQSSTKLQVMGLRDNMLLKVEEQIRSLENSKRRAAGAAEVPAEFSLALGSAHFRNGALTDALGHYQSAVRVRPRFGEAHNNLAVVYMMMGRLEDAEKQLKAAEQAGYRVNPQFKADLQRRLKGA
jgi:tetratricopeptide (TPR) repeat protein